MSRRTLSVSTSAELEGVATSAFEDHFHSERLVEAVGLSGSVFRIFWKMSKSYPKLTLEKIPVFY